MFTALLTNFDVTELLNDGVKIGGGGQNMNYDNDICISVLQVFIFQEGMQGTG